VMVAVVVSVVAARVAVHAVRWGGRARRGGRGRGRRRLHLPPLSLTLLAALNKKIDFGDGFSLRQLVTCVQMRFTGSAKSKTSKRNSSIQPVCLLVIKNIKVVT
jgi:hypothetical protein